MSARCIPFGMLWVLLMSGSSGGADPADQPPASRCQFRRPVALVVAADGRRLYAANRESGSISVIDLQTRTVADEIHIGRRLESLVATPDGRNVLVIDSADNALCVLRRRSRGLEKIDVSRVSTHPIDLAVSPDGRSVFVSSLWARRLSILDFDTESSLQTRRVVDLPFAPSKICVLPDGRHVIVADAFGGNLAVIHSDSGEIHSLHAFAANNIRGLSISACGTKVFLAHQVLHDEVGTTAGGVHWGGVMSNVIRTVETQSLLAGSFDFRVGGLFYLGDPDHAAGDPTGLIVTRDERQIVCFAGIDQIGISDAGANYFRAIPVGRRPTALALDPRQQLVFVANTFSDSVSVIEMATGVVQCEISLGATPELDPVHQGERLFYDARLSSDGWYSCHSCHTDGHSNGGLNDNFGDDSYGAPKRVLSLLGVRNTAPYSWLGKTLDLETQIRESIEVTMQGAPPEPGQVAALAAYVSSLTPPPSVSRARDLVNDERIRRGREVFDRAGCASCHEPGNYTSPEVYDVGLEDRIGNRRFNPPSLLGVSQRDRLFHDNRASSLEEVLLRFRHNLSADLEETSRADLIEFLRSL